MRIRALWAPGTESARASTPGRLAICLCEIRARVQLLEQAKNAVLAQVSAEPRRSPQRCVQDLDRREISGLQCRAERGFVVTHLVVRIAVPAQLARYSNQQQACGPKNPTDLSQQRSRRGNVFQNVIQKRRIKTRVVEGQNVRFHQSRIQTLRLAVRYCARIDVDANRIGPESQKIAYAAADIDGPSVQAAVDSRVKSMPTIQTADAAAPHQIFCIGLGRRHRGCSTVWSFRTVSAPDESKADTDSSRAPMSV